MCSRPGEGVGMGLDDGMGSEGSLFVFLLTNMEILGSIKICVDADRENDDNKSNFGERQGMWI